MVRFRNGWLVIVAAASLAAACGKKDDKAGDKATDKMAEPAGGGKMTAPEATPAAGGAGGTAATPTTPSAPGAPIPPPSATVSSDLGLIPADSEFVLGFNFGELRQSALWKQVEPMVMAKASGDLAKFKDRCGFDPIEALQSVTIGMKNIDPDGGTPPDLTAIIHGPDKTKVLACIDKSKDEAAAKGTTIAIDGNTVVITHSKDTKSPTVVMTYLDDTTALMIMSATASKDSIKAVAAGASGLKSSAAFNDMFSKINTSASLWGLANGSSKVFDKVPAIAGRPKAIFGSLDVAAGLSVDMHVRFDTAEHAKQIADMGKSQIAGATKFVTKLVLDADGADVHLAVDMTTEQLGALVKQFQGLAGSLMGGGASSGTTSVTTTTTQTGPGDTSSTTSTTVTAPAKKP